MVNFVALNTKITLNFPEKVLNTTANVVFNFITGFVKFPTENSLLIFKI